MPTNRNLFYQHKIITCMCYKWRFYITNLFLSSSRMAIFSTPYNVNISDKPYKLFRCGCPMYKFIALDEVYFTFKLLNSSIKILVSFRALS